MSCLTLYDLPDEHVLEDLLYREALQYYKEMKLGKLRELHEKAYRLGLSYSLNERLEQLIYALEEAVLRKIEHSLTTWIER